eukprot:09258.XXX_609425_609553_1 [CDS] Oithona nana genome sequencing.
MRQRHENSNFTISASFAALDGIGATLKTFQEMRRGFVFRCQD